MLAIDISKLLEDRQQAPPCGPDLEYSGDYVTLSRLVEGQPEVHYGTMRQAAQAPVWTDVQRMALALLEQSHDLRVAVWLTTALLALRAFEGLEQGLALVEGLLQRHWNALYPPLDAEDNDATIRVNALLALNEKTGVVWQVIVTPLVRSPSAGSVSLRDILVASGEYPPVEGEASRPGHTVMDSAFALESYENLFSTLGALKRANEHVLRIETLLHEYTGTPVGFPALRNALDRAEKELALRLDKHPGRDHGAPHIESATQPEKRSAGSTVESRVDVLSAMTSICDYYARCEPGSPVPLLVQRAKRFVDMDFVEIVTQLAPGGLDEVLKVAGIGKGDSK